MSILQEGIKKGYISISDDEKHINYCNHPKPRIFTNPEEKVQAEAFLKLVIDYGYDPKRIKQFVHVKMGSDSREADMIVYADDECNKPHILVECKKQEVSEQEFQQAIEQAYSYAYALPNDVKYVWVTSELKNEYFEVDKKKNSRVTQPDIPQFGVKKLANYKYVYEPESIKNETGKQKFFDLNTISEEDLTRRFRQAHDALWAGGQLNPSEAFDELDKLIFCKIWDERKDRKPGQPYDFQIITIDKEEIEDPAKRRYKENDELTERVRKLYEEGRKKDPEVFRDNIRLSPDKIRTVVGYLQEINLGETDLDSKGRAFETFMDSFFRGNFGQYFTPRQIVKFTTDVLPITNESLVLDTSCGSGGFLLYALNKVRKQANELYPNHKKDIKQNQKHYKFWHDFAEKNLYGIEINEQISRAAKMNMIIHDDGHTNVITADGLLNEQEIQKITQNKGFKYNHFDFIITNPPFGSSVKKTEKSYLVHYDFGKKDSDWLDVKSKNTITPRENQSTEVLFLEQCHNFLREGGYLAVVIPDGILTNSSLQYVRDGLEDKFRIVAVVSMPQTAFTATGAGVKSSVLFVKKQSKVTTEKLQNTKAAIQINLKAEFEYHKKLELWEKEKTKKVKDLDGFKFLDTTLSNTDQKKTEEYKTWKEEISAFYSDKVNALKEELQDAYQQAKQTKLPDYPIFMAIAEDIGYDATGKKTNNNELDFIGNELTKFIMEIENSKL
ncbi:N-6 DNA methylase [Flavobacterium sp. M31R6]|uniref:restriction endonuclease subunit M n=1 Tax=Flavobacterium sp. M31R6 TaxID=2739062 RepID=UPI0015688A47|nr:N-6 DNA methylase [Flavobacterium sp. M31R6]QKJ63350.1 N-6 DNA methylase [Flavobacterium sp. M31R6]